MLSIWYKRNKRATELSRYTVFSLPRNGLLQFVVLQKKGLGRTLQLLHETQMKQMQERQGNPTSRKKRPLGETFLVFCIVSSLPHIILVSWHYLEIYFKQEGTSNCSCCGNCSACGIILLSEQQILGWMFDSITFKIYRPLIYSYSFVYLVQFAGFYLISSVKFPIYFTCITNNLFSMNKIIISKQNLIQTWSSKPALYLTIAFNTNWDKNITRNIDKIVHTNKKTLYWHTATIAELHKCSYMERFHSCKTNEPSILLSMDGGGGKFKGENISLKLEVGAGLNS